MAWPESIDVPKKIIDQDLGGEFSPEYLTAIREKMTVAKKIQADPHWEDIEIAELTDDDIKLWDECEKGILTPEQFVEYYQRVKAAAGEVVFKRIDKSGDARQLITTSRRNLLAMINHKFINSQAQDITAKKHRDRYDEFHMAA
jgi:hypothetical protein